MDFKILEELKINFQTGLLTIADVAISLLQLGATKEETNILINKWTNEKEKKE